MASRQDLWINSCLVLQIPGIQATRILGALKDIIFHFSLNKLGGPVAIYNASSQAAQLGRIPADLVSYGHALY